MSLHARTASAFAWNHIARSGEYILVYVISVVIARFLGAEIYGAYAVFLSAVQMLIVLSSYGLETSIVSNLPLGSEVRSRAPGPGVLTGLLLTRVSGIGIIAAGVVVVHYWIGSMGVLPPVLVNYMLVLFLLFFFRNLISLFASIHISTLNTRRMAVIALSARCLELVGVLVLFSLHKGLHEVLLLITATASLQLFALLPGSGIIRMRRGEQGEEASRIIRMGGRFWLSGLMEFILGRQADIILLGFFLVGQDSIGRYDASLGLAQGINAGMTAGFMGVATASFASLGGRDQLTLSSYWEYLSRVALLLVVPTLVLTIVTAEVVIPAIYSRDFLSGVIFFRIFGATLVATRFLGGGLAANLLSAMGRTDLILRSSVLSGGTNLLLAAMLIPFLGTLGAVIATSAGAIVIAAMHARYARSLVRVSFPWKFGFAISGLSLVSALAARMMFAVLPWIGIAGMLAVFIFSFLILLFIVKPFSVNDYEHFRASSAVVSGIVRPFTQFVRVDPHALPTPGGLTDRQKWAFGMIPEGKVVVDVGSSDSTLCRLLRERSRLAIAVDVDEEALERARESDLRAILVEASATRLPFRTGSVDTVLFLDVLEHVDSERLAIEEIHRILRPGGTLLLSVPHAGLFEFLDPQNMSARFHGRPSPFGYHRHYSATMLERLFEGRFSIKRKQYGSLFLYPLTFAAANFLKKHFSVDAGALLRRLGDIDNDLSWGRFSYNLMVYAEKTEL
jgi:O-antigen/teichoic acid export membrane protein/ubiquinone/menaquinone biosynthesis C-methylase UbiE